MWTIEGENGIFDKTCNSESFRVRFRTTHITRPSQCSNLPTTQERAVVLANLSHSWLDRQNEVVLRIGGENTRDNEGWDGPTDYFGESIKQWRYNITHLPHKDAYH